MAKKLSKRRESLLKKIDPTKKYGVDEAMATLKELKSAKFDETVEVALNLNVDPRHADQMVRGSVVLPNGTGKNVRVAVFAKDAKADEAKAAGADLVGSDELIEQIQAGNIDFDIVISTPDMMGVLGKVENAKGGQVNFRVDKKGNIHAGIGKVSFDTEKIKENFNTFMEAINKAKPASAKGRYITNAAVSLTMSPSVTLDTAEVMDIK